MIKLLTFDEKNKIKEVVSEALTTLNVNPNINLAYFLNEIDETNNNIKSLELKLQRIIKNQEFIDQKLNLIINKLNK